MTKKLKHTHHSSWMPVAPLTSDVRQSMFKYEDGSDILIGDNVLIENGKTPGVVDLIITTEDEAKSINVDEIGIMLKSPPFGLVYFSKHWLEEDPLRFVSRAKV